MKIEELKPYLTAIVTLLAGVLLFSILNFFVVIDNNTGNNSISGGSDEAGEVEYDVSKFKSLSAKDFMDDTLKSKTIQVTYFGRKTCGHCVQYIPIMNQAMSYLGITFNYVDISNIDSTTEEYTLMKNLINDYYHTTDPTNFPESSEAYGITPMLLATQKGKIVNSSLGSLEYEDLLSFLEEDLGL